MFPICKYVSCCSIARLVLLEVIFGHYRSVLPHCRPIVCSNSSQRTHGRLDGMARPPHWAMVKFIAGGAGLARRRVVKRGGGMRDWGHLQRKHLRKVRVPIGVVGGGVWGRVQVGGGGGFPVENKGKGDRGLGGWGLGWGGDRQRNWQVNAHAFVKTTLSKLPFSLSPNKASAKQNAQIFIVNQRS